MAEKLTFKTKSHPNALLSGNATQDLLEGDGFHISYIPSSRSVLMGIGSGDGGGAETALCKNGKYLILNGDWREKYEAVAHEGYAACLALHNANKKEHSSSWSEDEKEDAS